MASFAAAGSVGSIDTNRRGNGGLLRLQIDAYAIHSGMEIRGAQEEPGREP